ncbi:hypothetical protein MKEN_00214200 [Mycena kentingensis (nom. inval.)]|nr:hypothetical protein MKEN_00214200 [Mycena kentingensis (nom. inval.)]
MLAHYPPQGLPPAYGSCDNFGNCRTLFGITWGSLVSVFACVWISVHPNVPAPTSIRLGRPSTWWRRAKWELFDSHWTSTAARLRLMLVALLAPELIFGFAARQFIIAGYFAKYNISRTHGFFICMGGFVDEDGHPLLTTAQLRKHRDGLACIPEAEILDKSKVDTLSKTFASLQGLWFIVQCGAQTVQGLPLTALEISTLVFVVVNVPTYVLWWQKPLQVQTPIILMARASESTFVHTSSFESESTRCRTKKNRRPLWTQFRALLGACYDGSQYNPRAEYPVPTFWHMSYEDYLTSDTGTRTDRAILAQLAISVLFGAIHCTGWLSGAFFAPFPTTTEFSLWRISSLVLVGIPATLMIFCSLTYMYNQRNDLVSADVVNFVGGAWLFLSPVLSQNPDLSYGPL